MERNRIYDNLKKVSALLVIVSLVLGCCACSKSASIEPMEKEKSTAISFDIIGGEDVMPIAGFYGPYVGGISEDGLSSVNYISDEIWSAIAECGINVMSYAPLDYSTSPEQIINNLNYGEKYNIAVVINDETVRKMGAGYDIDMEALTLRLSEYINHPAFGGIYITDEPYTDTFDPMPSVPSRELYQFEKISKVLNHEINIFTYENMLSSGVKPENVEKYEQYLRECCDTLQPKYLLYDRYPFDEIQEGYLNRYFYDLAVARKVAMDYKIPLWTYIQAGSQWNDGAKYFDSEGYYPNEGEFDWNINTCLAFGAQGLTYFTVLQPTYFAYAKSTAYDFERNGLIGAWGNKNRWYYYAQDMSKQIQAIDEVLMNAVNKGVLACGEVVNNDMDMIQDESVLLKGTSWRELKDVKGDALIGCFNYQGKTALYVVNYSTEYAQKVQLEFHESCQITVIQDGKSSRIQSEGITLDMLAGGGALIVFE